jgi:hypothetical protein
MFKQEVQLAARMRWAVTRSMTDAARAEGITSYNLFVRENQHAFAWSTTAGSEPAQRATEGSLVVDYASLRLSIGDVAPVLAEEATVSEDNVLDVRFSRGTGRGFDEVYLYVYVPELKKGFLSSSVYRRDKRITLALPDDFAGRELHAWLMVKSDDGRWSESAYVEVSTSLQVNGSALARELDERTSVVAAAVPSGSGVDAEGGRGVSHSASLNSSSGTHPASAGHP